MYSSSYTPLLDDGSGTAITVSTVTNGAVQDGILAIDTMDDNKVVFIAGENLAGLRANGRLRP